ncbi:hypothetical protein G6F35_015523 [Rhizopus arrhizus]|nr:hypothetical protein G6F35_015523 [Rhizopus arrhizus]
MRIVAGDVRRVAGDQVEARGLQRRVPVMPALGEAHVAQFMACGVARGYGQRTRAGIGGQYLRLRPFAGQRQRDRAAAGTEVGQLQRAAQWKAIQCQFHQQFGFRARNQRGRVDLQVQRPEPAATGQRRAAGR